MKLIDMLVEDGLNGWQWPDGIKCITQDNGSSIYKGIAFGYYKEPHLKKNIWLAANVTGHADVKVKKYDAVADDWSTAIITREQYEAALVAKNDGWIEWGGGERPVPVGTLVDVKWRDGRIDDGLPAGVRHSLGREKRHALDWGSDGVSCDIIAYRLHKLQEATEADDESDLNECIGQDVTQVWSGDGLPPAGCQCEYQYKVHGSEWCPLECVAVDGKAVFGWSNNTPVALRSNTHNFRPLRSEVDKKREEAIMSLAKAGGAAPFKYGEKLSDGQLLGSVWYELYDAIAAGKVPGMKVED